MKQTVENPRGHGGGPGSSGPGSGFATAMQQTREPRSLPLDAPNHDPPGSDRPQQGMLSPGEEALRSETGPKMQSVPQRDRDQGVGPSNTKRVKLAPYVPILLLIIGA